MGSTFYVFLLIIAAAGIALYLLVILREVPGAAEERLGKFEELPADLGKWRSDVESEEGKRALGDGQRREERFWLDRASGFGGPKLLRQVRYRSVETNEIVRAEPDEVVKRKRLRG
jgi:hypothetical protein